MARYLTSEYTVISPDLPGFGDSSKILEADYDIDSQVKRINQFVEALQLTDFHIAGNSMGGYIAGNFAARYPDKINRLWLINTLGVSDALPSEMFNMLAQGEQPPILVSQPDDFEQLLSFVFHQPPFMPSLVTDVLADKAVANHPLHQKIFHQIHRIEHGKVIFTRPLNQQLQEFDKRINHLG